MQRRNVASMYCHGSGRGRMRMHDRMHLLPRTKNVAMNAPFRRRALYMQHLRVVVHVER